MYLSQLARLPGFSTDYHHGGGLVRSPGDSTVVIRLRDSMPWR